MFRICDLNLKIIVGSVILKRFRTTTIPKNIHEIAENGTLALKRERQAEVRSKFFEI